MSNNFNKVPIELKQYNQWVCWRFEEGGKKPTKVPYNPKTREHANVVDSSTFVSFDEALAGIFNNEYDGIGFVLTDKDPYFCIDLDDPEGKFDLIERQIAIQKEFESYAEISPSGKGLHIWGIGEVPSGRKRDRIEIYSNCRFMSVTGNVYKQLPFKNLNDRINILWAEMSQGNVAKQFYSGLTHSKFSDQEVLDIAYKAANGEKFYKLFSGKWADYYPSQSEADLALINIIAFYSQNRKQIERLFKSSELGKRKKANRKDYIYWMINKSFDEMLPPVDVEGLQNRFEEVISTKIEKIKLKREHRQIYKDNEFVPLDDIYSKPPGLVGEIAKYLYEQAPRPVPEIALTGAFALMAGICGRAYNISGTGLNQYFLLLADTGTGKEAIASGISKLMTEVAKTVPSSKEFLGPGEIASPQALIKYLANKSKCFVSIVGEIGLQLQQMTKVNCSPAMLGLRRSLLDLYNKSGEGHTFRPTIAADTERCTAEIPSPAVSLCGDTTPERFYEGLHEGMISEGFLPRFTIIQYYGPRPELNESHSQVKPPVELLEKVARMATYALSVNHENRTIKVKLDKVAEILFRKFDLHCDKKVNEGNRDAIRQLWSRCHVKALKLAAIVAVGIDPVYPTITEEIGKYAIGIIVSDCLNLVQKFELGLIGLETSDARQMMELTRVIREYFTIGSHRILDTIPQLQRLYEHKIIPYQYIQKRAIGLGCFKNDRRGATKALKDTLRNLIDNGEIQELSKIYMQNEYGTTALCYMLSMPEAFLDS